MSEGGKRKPVPKYMRFIIGGSAGMSGAAIVQPFDFIKTRMQMSGLGVRDKQYKSTWDMRGQVLRREGPLVFLDGLTASLLRQATYTTARMGVYTIGFERLSADGPVSFWAKISLGMVAGICGAFVGTPADVCLVRMMTEGQLPPEKRHNYKNVVNALVRIVQDEGVSALWRGGVPTTIRAVVINACQLGTYSQIKEYLLATPYFQDNIWVHLTSSMASAFITTIASLPVDTIKTRMQNATGRSSLLNMVATIIREEGLLSLWKGFTPYLARLGSHTVLVLVLTEQYTRIYEKQVLRNESKGRTF